VIASFLAAIQAIGAIVAGAIVVVLSTWAIAVAAIFMAALVGFGAAAPDQKGLES